MAKEEDDSYQKDNLDNEVFLKVPPEALDTGWAWLIMVSSFMIQAFTVGTSFTIGVYYVEWLDTFGRSKSYTAWVGSLNTGIMFGAGPIASALTNRYGHRTVALVGGVLASGGMAAGSFAPNIIGLMLTYGVMTGLGYGLMYVPGVVTVGLYFEKRRKVAMAFSFAGPPLGSLVAAPLLRMLIKALDWRGALLVHSGICLHALIFASFLRPVEFWYTSNQLRRHDVTKKCNLAELFEVSLLKEFSFYLFVINGVLSSVGILILYAQITDYGFINGISKDQGAIIISGIGISNLLARISSVTFIGHRKCNPFLIYVIAPIISGICIALIPISVTFPAFMAFGVLFGGCFGFQLSAIAATTIQLFGLQRLAGAYGYCMFGCGLGFLLGPPVAGWLYEATGGYEIPFYFGGAINILSGVLLLPVLLTNTLQNQRPETHLGVPVETEIGLIVPVQEDATKEKSEHIQTLDELEDWDETKSML